MENPKNIVFICSDCTQKIAKPYTGPLSKLVGGSIKTSFPTEDPMVLREHMWVKVNEVVADAIIGELDNEPAFTTAIKLGARVVVNRPAIEDWHFPENEKGG